MFLCLAISVLRTTDSNTKKNSYFFQINTPRRIYRLQASSEQEMNHWIDGVNSIIRRLTNTPVESDSQLLLELEQANNRISDLEADNEKLRRGLHLAAQELSTTVENIIQQADSGVAALTGVQLKSRNLSGSNTNSNTNSNIQLDKTENNQDESSKNDESDSVSQVTNTTTSKDEEKNEEEEEEEEEEFDAKQVDEEEIESDNSTTESADIDSSGHFGARVKFDYEARKNYELTIKKDDIITVVSQHDNGWWLGCDSDGKQGYFPGSYVVPIETDN